MMTARMGVLFSGRERAVEKKKGQTGQAFREVDTNCRGDNLCTARCSRVGCRRARNGIRSRVYQTEAQDKPLALDKLFT